MSSITVSFDPVDMYINKPTIKADIVRRVKAAVPVGAVSAVVVNGWHTSRSDKRNHCTVDYKNSSGQKILRDHIV
ncbi:hypothetical protein H2198_008989 [Neophaeococcomyces mojaviensis]|uniref:Uncharacterized protein n=1 Tax=Neophaeococcomyces mojaviensis TaxID=3383035 RepID=A0ACC2ZVX5_9EURO|nr:hypothetical protein H2198_008989 [Knufia sp. JES_112]